MKPIDEESLIYRYMNFEYRIYNQNHAQAAHNFFSNYDLVKIITGTDHPSNLRPPESRQCRFCNRKTPAVSFNNQAHIIPHQLGNEYLISDFECDTCNKVFSRYEAQLANYLGISRTISKIKGKKGIPNFPSPKEEVTAKVEGFFNINDAIKIMVKKGMSIDPQTGTTEIEFPKHPYKPLQVFKALVRVGFCMLSEIEIEDYRKYISEGLLSGNQDEYCKSHPAFTMYSSNLPRPQKCTFALLFKKKCDFPIPSHELIVFTQSTMFQLMLPFCKQDKDSYRDFKRFIFPPGHFADDHFHAETTTKGIDLSDIGIKKENGMLSFSFDPQRLKNLSAYNPITKEFEERKNVPTDIKGVIIVEKGQAVNFPSMDNFKTK